MMYPRLKSVDGLKTLPQATNTPADGLKTPPQTTNTPADGLKTPPLSGDSIRSAKRIDEVVFQIQNLGPRINDANQVIRLILRLCAIRAFRATEIANLFNREEDYFKRKYLSNMIANKELVYKYPDMINHPEQAYITAKTDKQ